MAPKTLPYPNPTTSVQYAEDLDVFLGAKIVTQPDAAVTNAWVQSESPSFPGFNGLGTELYLKGAKPDPSNPKVYDYKNLDQGLTAAADMMAGGGPQTSPDAAQFVKDIQSGTATQSQLVEDVYSSHWAGTSIPDNYDASMIASKLGIKAPSGAPQPASPASSGVLGDIWHTLTTPPSIPGVTSIPGGGLPGIAHSAVSGIAGTVGNYILKGVLSLTGAGLIFYGATLLTGHGGKSSAPAAASGGAAAGAFDPAEAVGPEDAFAFA